MGKEKNEEHGGGGAEVQRELTWALDRELWVCYQRSCTIEAVNSSKKQQCCAHTIGMCIKSQVDIGYILLT